MIARRKGRSDSAYMQMQELQMTPPIKDLATTISVYLPELHSWAWQPKLGGKRLCSTKVRSENKNTLVGDLELALRQGWICHHDGFS